MPEQRIRSILQATPSPADLLQPINRNAYRKAFPSPEALYTRGVAGTLPEHFKQAKSEADEATQLNNDTVQQGSAGFPSIKRTPGRTDWELDPEAKNPQGQPQGTFKSGDAQRGVFPAMEPERINSVADTEANDVRDNNTWMMPDEFEQAHGPVPFNKNLQGRPSSGALMSAKEAGVFRPKESFEDILTMQRYADSKFAPGQDILTGSEVRSEPHASSHPTMKPQYTSREGIADGSTKKKTAYQLEQNNSDPHGLPRVEGMGEMLFDGTANDEKGGYRNRAPDQAAANQAAEAGNIHAEARAYNLNPSDPQFKDDPASLELAVAKMQNRAKTKERMFKTVSVPGGGLGYTANDRANSQDDDRRRNQWVAEQSRRYGPQLTANNVSEQVLGEAYDSGLAKSKGRTQQERHTDAGLAGNVFITGPGGTKNLKNNQINQNVEQNWSQINRGRKWGVSQGQVAFYDSLQNAKTPMDQANVLLLAHSANPQMGYGNMAALVMKGKIETDQLSQWAAGQGAPKPSGPDRLGVDIRAVTDQPRDATSHARLKMIAKTTNAPTASDGDNLATVASWELPWMTKTFAGPNARPTANDQAHGKQVIGHMEYPAFLKYMNLDDSKQSSADLYERISGKRAKSSRWFSRVPAQAAPAPAQAPTAPPLGSGFR